MLALQACGTDAVATIIETAKVLRSVLPRRWFYRLTGDPVALLLRLPIDLRAKVLVALFSIPEEPVDQQDQLESVRRAQRAIVYGKGGITGPQPSLAIASLSCRTAFGEGWYYAPDRWPTADGYAPFGVVWLEYIGLQALEARERLVVADGTALASAKDAPRVRQQLLRLAFPGEIQ